MAQAPAEEFAAPYLFLAGDKTVIIRHALEKNLRHRPGHPKQVNAEGGFGKLARWKTKLRTVDNVIEAQFQNEHTNEYLRIMDGGNGVDVGGHGGPLCWFRVHIQNVGIVKLESVKHEGKYIAVDKNGVRVGAGGPWCRLHVLREGPAPPFSKPYVFLRKNTVIIEHRDGKHVRVAGENSHDLTSEGGKGQFARFEAIPGNDGKTVQLKSMKNGKFLRIRNGEVDCGGVGLGPWTHFLVHPVDAPNHARLESQKEKGSFIMLAPHKQSFKVGDGENKRCFFTFYREE